MCLYCLCPLQAELRSDWYFLTVVQIGQSTEKVHYSHGHQPTDLYERPKNFLNILYNIDKNTIETLIQIQKTVSNRHNERRELSTYCVLVHHPTNNSNNIQLE